MLRIEKSRIFIEILSDPLPIIMMIVMMIMKMIMKNDNDDDDDWRSKILWQWTTFFA